MPTPLWLERYPFISLPLDVVQKDGQGHMLRQYFYEAGKRFLRLMAIGDRGIHTRK